MPSRTQPKKKGVNPWEGYDGPLNPQGLPNGRGIMKWTDGEEYEGAFAKGIEHGFGKLTFANGDVYEGQFVDGYIKGKGSIQYNSDGKRKGDRYTGLFLDGIPHGKGKYQYAPEHAKPTKYKKVTRGRRLFPKTNTGDTLALDTEETAPGGGQGQGAKGGSKKVLLRQPESDQNMSLMNDDIGALALDSPTKVGSAPGSGLGGGGSSTKEKRERRFEAETGLGMPPLTPEAGQSRPGTAGGDVILRAVNEYDTYEGHFEKGIENDPEGRYTYKDGSVYTGPIIDNKFQGKGTIKFCKLGSASMYGQDSLSGDSTLFGEVFAGMFENDMFKGEGKYRWENGNTYIGNFRDDLRHGTGVFKRCNGDVYEGKWEQDMREGLGTYKWKNGDTFVGTWVAGNRLEGTYTSVSGDIFSGPCSNNMRHGHYYVKFANGDEYFGTMERDLMHGRGKYTWKNGGTYQGEWQEGAMSGQGTMRYADGDRYTGFFSSDSKHGAGVYKYRYVPGNGDVYTGYFENGARHGGDATLFYKRKQYTFYGSYFRSKKNGEGYVLDKSGTIIQQGYWREGHFQQPPKMKKTFTSLVNVMRRNDTSGSGLHAGGMHPGGNPIPNPNSPSLVSMKGSSSDRRLIYDQKKKREEGVYHRSQQEREAMREQVMDSNLEMLQIDTLGTSPQRGDFREKRDFVSSPGPRG